VGDPSGFLKRCLLVPVLTCMQALVVSNNVKIKHLNVYIVDWVHLSTSY
jgi:hypothetical protein